MGACGSTEDVEVMEDPDKEEMASELKRTMTKKNAADYEEVVDLDEEHDRPECDFFEFEDEDAEKPDV